MSGAHACLHGGKGKWVAGAGAVGAAKRQERQLIRRGGEGGGKTRAAGNCGVHNSLRDCSMQCLIRSFPFSQGTISFHCVHFISSFSAAGTVLSWTHCCCMLTDWFE